jgi:hypothetical protein
VGNEIDYRAKMMNYHEINIVKGEVYEYCVRFEVSTAVAMKNAVL